MSALPDLARRFSRALDKERGAQFTGDDLALLAAIGVNDLLQAESAKYLRTQCLQRSARSRSTSGESSDSTRGPTEEISKSSGTTKDADASEALRLVQAITG